MSRHLVPVPKVVAAGLGGALATLAVWLLGALGAPEVPAEAAAALSAVLAFVCGYIKAPAEDETLAAAWLAREGARPTEEDVRRLIEASEAGQIPRRTMRPTEDDPS